MKNRFIAVILMLMTGNAIAENSARVSPLLIEGKQTLYQRVLAIPQARMFPTAKDDGAGKDVIPFTAFYVYARKKVGKREWLKLGTDRHGTIAGWIPSARTMEWNQGLTVAFRDPVGGERSLLFRDRESLKGLLDANDRDAYSAIYLEAQSGLSSPESPVVAIQPDVHLDVKEDFYLVPIHKYEDVFMGAEQARMLQVSSVPLEYEGPAISAPVQSKTKKKRNYSAGLVFAIDSTLSMDKYIDRTREAVGKIFSSLDQANLLGNVNFGLVSFRDNTSAAPGIGYLSRTYVKLSEGQDSHGFLSRVEKLSATTVSSRDFVEDAYAGVKRAIEDMEWSNHHARYVVLITDAGARGEGDPLSSTGMTAEGLRQLALDNGVSIFVLHLLTPATEANHASAEDQYRRLSDIPGIGSLYYGVPTGDVVEFGYVLDSLAAQITDQVRIAVDNRPMDSEEADTGATEAEMAVSEPATPQLAEFQEKVAKLGYALRMRYLKTSESGKVPNVFNAWILDRDFNDPERKVLDIRVLLTRDQLSDLHDILRQILNTAEEGLLSPKNFLNELKSLAATTSRDPSKLGTTTAVTAGEGNSLADLGFMREYIEDLPYTADAMKLSLQDWQSWSAREQIKFLNALESKINYYRALHDHTDLWVSLGGGPVDGDSVFPIALDMLP